MQNILETIIKNRLERGWTEYELAERSGLPQSTISSWYRKNMLPTISSLEKICNAFNITLSQFFNEDERLTTITITKSQKELIDRWSRLNKKQQTALFALLDTF